MKTIVLSIALTLCLSGLALGDVTKCKQDSMGKTNCYDSQGRRIGSVKKDPMGNDVFYDKKGSRTGKAKKDASGNTNYYDKTGKRIVWS
ncbi:MAG: hypothetical protein LBU69_00050 [Deltaproteobacteria bacterium]|jgi:hypothetical protein|nr:hypothetical protein [Deltaproteobacteria bacterium]